MSITKEKGQKTLVNSEEAASKVALSETIQHPMTIWPPAFGIAAGIGLTVLGMVSMPVAITIGSVCVLGGATNWAVRFFGGKDAYIQKYYAKLHEQFERLKEEKVVSLEKDLKSLKCSQGREQVSEFEAKFGNLVDVLKMVLSEGELAFGRYLGAAETVYTSGIETLVRVVTILTSIEEIDRVDLEERITGLKSIKEKSGSETRHMNTLLERAKLYDDGMKEVEELLVSNEEALTTLDKTAGAIGRIKVCGTSDDLSMAMADLLSLIGRITQRANVGTLEL
ncbi:MAG: hypothetical protein WC827_00985 [Candidatus Paceibacterota bacterium]|jgi:hypothetical protein